MPKFRSAYDSLVVSSVSGSDYEPVYTASYDDSGVLILELTGKKNVYEEIQSYKDSVDINYLIARYRNGDVDVLSKVQGFYEDVTEMPKTYQDVLNSVIKTEQFFDELPVSDKEKFNNSFSQFMVAIGDPDFWDKYFPAPERVYPDDSESGKEVIDDES